MSEPQYLRIPVDADVRTGNTVPIEDKDGTQTGEATIKSARADPHPPRPLATQGAPTMHCPTADQVARFLAAQRPPQPLTLAISGTDPVTSGEQVRAQIQRLIDTYQANMQATDDLVISETAEEFATVAYDLAAMLQCAVIR